MAVSILSTEARAASVEETLTAEVFAIVTTPSAEVAVIPTKPAELIASLILAAVPVTSPE